MVVSSIMATPQTLPWPARPPHKRSPRLSWTFSVSLSLRARLSQSANLPAFSHSHASRYLEKFPQGAMEGIFRSCNHLKPYFKKFKRSRYRRIAKNTSKMNQRRLRKKFLQWRSRMMKIRTPPQPADQLNWPCELYQCQSWSLKTCDEWNSQEGSLWPALIIQNCRSVLCARTMYWGRSLLLKYLKITISSKILPLPQSQKEDLIIDKRTPFCECSISQIFSTVTRSASADRKTNNLCKLTNLIKLQFKLIDNLMKLVIQRMTKKWDSLWKSSIWIECTALEATITILYRDCLRAVPLNSLLTRWRTRC